MLMTPSPVDHMVLATLNVHLASVKDRIVAATRRICAAGATSGSIAAIDEARALLVEHDHLARAIADGLVVPPVPDTKVAEE